MMNERSRLYWQCRRGMRELDLLLKDFLDQSYAGLDDQDRRAMEALLECPDALMLEWLMGRSLPTDGEIARIVQRIRNTATA